MLVFDQPIDQGKPGTRASTPASSGFDLLALFRLLWRRKTTIVAAALGCAIAAVVIGKSLSPKFTATAQLYVDPRELQLVDRELTPRAQDVSGLSMVVESQARLITSNSVLLKVIQNTGLDKDPEFGGESKGALTSLLGLFGIELRFTAAPKDSGPAHSVEAMPPSRASEPITPPPAVSASRRSARYTLDLPLPLGPVMRVTRPSGVISWRNDR